MTTMSPTARKASRTKATEGAALPTGFTPNSALMPTSRSSRRAFTLVEIMVVVAISAMILGGVMSSYIAILKSSMRLWNYEKMEREANRGLEYFARDVRGAKAIVWGSTSSITLTVPRVSGGGDRTVVYGWNSTTKIFSKTESGTVTPLVRDVQTFSFNRFNLAQAAAANDYETNQIQVTMTASPPTQGLYSESTKRVLSARYVLRNR